MKILVILLILVSTNLINANDQPWKVTGEFTYSHNKPLECQLNCSLALLKKAYSLQLFKDNFYTEEMKLELENWILHAPAKFLEVLSFGRSMPVFIKEINITPFRGDESFPSGKFSLSNVDVRISFLFSTPEVVEELNIEWKIFPNSLLKLKKLKGQETNPDDYEVKIKLHGKKNMNVALTSDNPFFTWYKNPQVITPVAPLKETLTVPKRSQIIVSMLAILLGTFFSFLCWLIIDQSKFRSILMLVVFGAVITVPWFKDFRGKEAKEVYKLPDTTAMNKMMTRLLKNIYRGPSADDSNTMFQDLAKATIGEFRDNTFAQIHKSRVEHPETQQIIQDLKIESCRAIGEKQIECQWVISAYIMHLHHIHKKDLRFKAVFKLHPATDRWLIEAGEVIPVFTEDDK